MNRRQKEVYAALTLTPPTSDRHGWGAAYWYGFRNSDLSVENAGPIIGLPGSEARAAFMAGRAAAKRLSKEANKS
jgi:hypothetical protein